MDTHLNHHTAFSFCSRGGSVHGASDARPSRNESLLFCHTTGVGSDCTGIIATGADTSSRIGLGYSAGVALSYNHGCLGNERSLVRFDDTLRLMTRNFPPEVVATDSHPSLVASRVARSTVRRTGARLVTVDHAHAHAVAVMAEHGLRGDVVAVVLDSGRISETADSRRMRGSELLVCSRTGSEVALRADGIDVPRCFASWEAAVGLILHYTGSLRWIPAGFMEAVGRSRVLDAARRCSIASESVRVTGGAALWDAVAALIATEQGHEDGALMRGRSLEHMAEGIMASPYDIDMDDPLSFETPLDEMLDDLAGHTDARVVAARFHAARARQWAVAASRLCASRRIRRVVVTGDMLVNRLFSAMLARQLQALGLEAYFPRTISSTDSGIALGQAVVAASLRA